LCDPAGQYGLNIPSDSYATEGVRMLRTSDISADGTTNTPVDGVFVPEELARPLLLRDGDLLLSRSGTLGRALLYDFAKHGRSTFAAYLVRFTPKPSVYPRYLWFATQSSEFQAQIAAGSIESTISNFNAEKYCSVEVPDWPIATQQAIADFLDAETSRLDRLIDANFRVQARLNERRETLTALGVSGRLIGLTTSKSRLPWLEALPTAWPVIKLTLIARLGSGHTPSRHHPEWWQEATIPWVTTGEVQQMREDRIEYIFETRERISELGLANSSAELHPAGTVLLCRTASAGFSAIMGVPMATSQDFVTWTCGPLLRPRYLLLCLRAMRQDLLGRLAMGSTHQTIYVPDIESIRVPLPPVAQQDQIIETTWLTLKEADQLVDHLAHQIELLHERRQAMITAAVTGQISVPAVASA
jgi:type I restriction enzyme, S subunit